MKTFIARCLWRAWGLRKMTTPTSRRVSGLSCLRRPRVPRPSAQSLVCRGGGGRPPLCPGRSLGGRGVGGHHRFPACMFRSQALPWRARGAGPQRPIPRHLLWAVMGRGMGCALWGSQSCLSVRGSLCQELLRPTAGVSHVSHFAGMCCELRG